MSTEVVLNYTMKELLKQLIDTVSKIYNDDFYIFPDMEEEEKIDNIIRNIKQTKQKIIKYYEEREK